MHQFPPESESSLAPSVRRVFISYAREDISWAQDHARVLRAVGINVFLDLDSIRAGDPWPAVLRQKVEKSDLVWLGWSCYSSHSAWVRHEYEAALARGPGYLRIDLLDETPLPPELQHIQAERAAYWQPRVERLLRDPVRTLPDDLGQPSVLLRPEYGVVPFTGREEILDRVHQWCIADPPFSVQLFVGPGGCGKTRLMMQACRRMRNAGWDARFLESEALQESLETEPDILDRLLAPRLPRLMVMDYAETRRQQIEALLDRGLVKDGGGPVRLILLARSAADWWQGLLVSRYEYQQLLGAYAEPVAVPPLAAEPQDRRMIFDTALQTFSELLGIQFPQLAVPDFSGRHFQRVLFLHMAALSLAQGQKIENRAQLLEFILQHEKRYWIRKAEDLNLPESLEPALEGAAAMIVVMGGCTSHDSLLQILASNPDLAELKRVERSQVAQLFMNLYAANGSVEPLQPDLLGEHLVARVFRRDRDLRTAWMQTADDVQIRNGFTILNRMAEDHPEAVGWLAELLKADLDRLITLAIEVALEGGDPLGKVLADCLAQSPLWERAYYLEGTLPHETIALREFAAEVTRQAIQHLEANFGDDSGQHASERAGLLNNLGIRLSELGRREAALAATEEAVGVYRQLAEARPDAFLPYLAGSLNNLGTAYTDLGETRRAIEFHEQALAIAREIGDRRLEIYSLNSIGNAFSKLQDHAQAVNYYSRMLVLEPDDPMTHRNRADSLIRLGRLDEAMTDCQASERLAPDHPMTHARWGQLHYAREQYSVSVDRFQRAASLKPDDPTQFNFDLALPLLCLGLVDEALQSIRARLAVHPHPSDLDDMIPEFEKLYQRYPDLPGLPEALQLLRSAAQPN